jgi:hypothetical protein
MTDVPERERTQLVVRQRARPPCHRQQVGADERAIEQLSDAAYNRCRLLPEWGAWYAAFPRETSELEVAYHKSKELQEISWQEKETFTYVDFLADFRGKFHDIQGNARFGDCLDANSYKPSQRLARDLLEGGSAGVVYPSVRHKGGTCIGCFRPALVNNVRKGPSISITFANALAAPEIRELK